MGQDYAANQGRAALERQGPIAGARLKEPHFPYQLAASARASFAPHFQKRPLILNNQPKVGLSGPARVVVKSACRRQAASLCGSWGASLAAPAAPLLPPTSPGGARCAQMASSDMAELGGWPRGELASRGIELEWRDSYLHRPSSKSWPAAWCHFWPPLCQERSHTHTSAPTKRPKAQGGGQIPLLGPILAPLYLLAPDSLPSPPPTAPGCSHPLGAISPQVEVQTVAPRQSSAQINDQQFISLTNTNQLGRACPS